MAYEPKREAIARELREAISQGIYTPGDKLPSARNLAVRHHSSLTTAQAAIGILKDEGIVEGRRGDGYFVITPGQRMPTLEDRVAAIERRLDELESRLSELEGRG